MEHELTKDARSVKGVSESKTSTTQIAQTKNSIPKLMLIKKFFLAKNNEKNYNPLPMEENRDNGEHHGYYGRLRYYFMGKSFMIKFYYNVILRLFFSGTNTTVQILKAIVL
jgi:hypothetical protein